MAAEKKKKEIKLKKAREELQKCKKSDVADSVAAILTASDQNHWHRINKLKEQCNITLLESDFP